MSIASATSTRVLLSFMSAAVAVALHTGCGSQGNERRGGTSPDLTAGSASSAGRDASAGIGAVMPGGEGGASSGPVSWCDAYRVVNCVCQQCHQRPTQHGAAMPLMTYEDTQAPYPLSTSTKLVWQAMQRAVDTGFMPFTGDATVMPAVKPLSDAQRHTLLTWLAQGATAAGGTDCAMTCDWSQDPPTGI